MNTECSAPPEGWRCTRGAGHEGPCAAIPSGGPQPVGYVDPTMLDYMQRRPANCGPYSEKYGRTMPVYAGTATPPTSASDAEVEVVTPEMVEGLRADIVALDNHWDERMGGEIDDPDALLDRLRTLWSALDDALPLTRSPARVGGETKDARDYEALYFDLIYQVGNKYAGESRHETAKRYLQRAEQSGDSQVAKQASP